MPASYVYGHITLKFTVQDRPVKVTVKYRYYAKDGRIEYESIECTDISLREKIQNDPAMREKINSYVTKILEKRDQGLS